MGIEDIPKIGKAAAATRAAKAAKGAEKVLDRVVIWDGGVSYTFNNMTAKDAQQLFWNKVIKPRAQGGEQKIDFPSELSLERQAVVAKQEAEAGQTNVVPIRAQGEERLPPKEPAKMEPGYYQRDDGSFFELTQEGTIIEHGA